MKSIDKIAEEQKIVHLLFNRDGSEEQNRQVYNLMREYQAKYKHPFPISVIDKYMEEIK